MIFLLVWVNVFPGPPPGEVSSPHEFIVVDGPKRAVIVLETDEALVQGQIRADRVLERRLIAN